MDNYLANFDGKDPAPKQKRRGVGFLMFVMACLICAVVSAGVSWAVCSQQLAQAGPTVSNVPDDQPVNAETPILNLNSTALTKGRSDEATIAVGQNVSPAVVFISNIQNVRAFSFNNWYSSRGVQTTEMVVSTGSGVIYSDDGYIITNNHVVSGAERLSVTLYNGNSYLAEVVGRDERSDLAVIKIEPNEELTVASFGDSDKLVVGETAIAIGNPGGENFTNSLTQGVISGLDRSVSTSDGTVLKVVQTDAAINPGNSGGALCNAKGEVIGINTIKIGMTGYEGMGFAIPSTDVLEICQQLIKAGKVVRPALGVGIICNVTPQLAYYNELSVDYGVMIEPSQGSNAEQAGLQVYDIIVALDEKRIETFSELQTAIFEHQIGDTVKVSVVRGEEKLDVEVTLQELSD